MSSKRADYFLVGKMELSFDSKRILTLTALLLIFFIGFVATSANTTETTEPLNTTENTTTTKTTPSSTPVHFPSSSTTGPTTTTASTTSSTTTTTSALTPTPAATIVTTTTTTPISSPPTTSTFPINKSETSDNYSSSTAASPPESSTTTRSAASRTSPKESTTTTESTTSATAATESSNVPIIIGVVVGVGGAALLALLIILIVCCCLRKRDGSPKKKTFISPSGIRRTLEKIFPVTPALPDRPIKVADFLDHVAHHQANISAYKAEFESLPAGNKVGKSVSRAKENQNNQLNRYINILPFNDSLVPLYKSDEMKGYINASFVDGYRKPKAYIASQAPVAESLGDFWQMIWEHDCGKIIMVTNLFECGRPKSERYWPNVNETKVYGDTRVEGIAEKTCGDYILRTFRIAKEPSNAKDKGAPNAWSKRATTVSMDKIELRDSRIVYQFHFTTWPDQGVPNTCTSILKLHRHSLDESLPDCRSGPDVIHCSAGVGRTGTLITLDQSLEQVKDQGTVDIPRCIDKLRRQRMYMVQTVEQYIFIHHVLLEALTLGKVETPCAQFESTYKQLLEPSPSDGLTRIQRELKVLDVLKPQFDQSQYSVAVKHRDKNRNSSLLPADMFMPYIRSEDEQNDTYVNAVYVFGYPKRKGEDEQEGSQYSYIATQSPMANTIEDFWMMVKETGSSTIVMLNDLEGVERYWPEDGRTLTYGSFSVTNMGEISSEDIRKTDLQVTWTDKSKTIIPMDVDETEYSNVKQRNTRSDVNTFKIHHFRLLTWPDAMPKESTMISLYGQLVQCQERNPDKPVVVHCLYGAERCGVFCGVMNVLDTIRLECEVDVYNSVKRIRRTRPEFIEELAQYKFLYDVAMEQIRSIEKVDYDGQYTMLRNSAKRNSAKRNR